MRISDWSSDVCSSDLWPRDLADRANTTANNVLARTAAAIEADPTSPARRRCLREAIVAALGLASILDRKRVVWGQSVSVRVDLGGRRISHTTKQINKETERAYQKESQY